MLLKLKRPWFPAKSTTHRPSIILLTSQNKMGCAKRIWYLSPMRAAKVQASLRIRAVSPEPPLLAHSIGESRGTFRQKARSLALLNGWACAVKICHDGMLEDTNSLDAAQMWNHKCYQFRLCIKDLVKMVIIIKKKADKLYLKRKTQGNYLVKSVQLDEDNVKK